MPYVKTNWVDEVPGDNPVTYDIEDVATGKTITPSIAPTPGTPLNATNMNKIEDGIAAAVRVDDRQGGDPDDWHVTPTTQGTTTYNPTECLFQVGSAYAFIPDGMTSYTLEVTFPEVFGGTPIITIGQNWSYLGNNPHFIAYVKDVTTAGFSIYIIPVDISAFPDNGYAAIDWMAIGPQA